MRKTRKQRTAGFTLVEVIVAIAIMGLVSAPICVSLVLAGRLNARSRAVMEAQLEVRTAVETLMAEGITDGIPSSERNPYRETDFPGVTVAVEKKNPADPYYHVTVSDKQTEPLVTVETYIRAVEAPEGSAGGGTGGGTGGGGTG